MLGHLMHGLPMHDFEDLDRQIWFTKRFLNQVTTALDGVIRHGFSWFGGIGDREQSALLIGDQEEALHLRTLDKERISFVATDQLAPVRLKVHKGKVLIECSH